MLAWVGGLGGVWRGVLGLVGWVWLVLVGWAGGVGLVGWWGVGLAGWVLAPGLAVPGGLCAAAPPRLGLSGRFGWLVRRCSVLVRLVRLVGCSVRWSVRWSVVFGGDVKVSMLPLMCEPGS